MLLLDMPPDILALLARRSVQFEHTMVRGGMPWDPKWALVTSRRQMLAETCKQLCGAAGGGRVCALSRLQ